MITRLTSKNTFYLVKWKHYSITESTWEPIQHLDQVKPLIEEYENCYKKYNRINEDYLNVPRFTPLDIIEEKTYNGKKEYKVVWKEIMNGTWEPKDSLDKTLIDQWKTKEPITITKCACIREKIKVFVKQGSSIKKFPIDDFRKIYTQELIDFFVSKMVFIKKK